jgi:hypothetical protein
MNDEPKIANKSNHVDSFEGGTIHIFMLFKWKHQDHPCKKNAEIFAFDDLFQVFMC